MFVNEPEHPTVIVNLRGTPRSREVWLQVPTTWPTIRHTIGFVFVAGNIFGTGRPTVC